MLTVGNDVTDDEQANLFLIGDHSVRHSFTLFLRGRGTFSQRTRGRGRIRTVTFQPSRGATLLIPSGPTGYHLFVVVTDEVDGEYLLVSVSSIKPNRYYDVTCEVSAGVHEFVRTDSFGFYGGARVDTSAHLVAMEAKGLFFPKADMPMNVVEALCDGIAKSPHTPKYILKFYEKYLDA